jgi:HEAT repeat protein
LKLTATQIADLGEIVQRRFVPKEEFNMANAITALAGAERSNRVAQILGQLLADESESSIDRAVAAINLRLMPGRTAQMHLVENLATKDLQVKRQVIKSLSTFGDADALAQLRKLRPPKDVTLRRQLIFAKALIAHRIGIPEVYLPFRRGARRTPGAESDMIARNRT